MASPPPVRNNKMGKWGATSYLIGNIVGSGVFISPTAILVAANSVGAALVIWIGSALVATFGAFCYIELGTSIRRSGGDYAYLQFVGWRPLAFSFMSMGCLYMYSLTTVIQSQTFAEYTIQGLGIKFESESSLYWSKKLIGFSLIWLLLFLNFFSLRLAVARFQMAASLAKVLSCGIIIATGFYFLIIKGQTSHFANPFYNSTTHPGQLVNAVFSGLFSYDGWDLLNFGVEEIADPRTTLPFAIGVTMLSVTAIFLCLQVSFFTVLSKEEFVSSVAVAQTFAKASLGRAEYIIPFLVCIILVGSLNGTLFTASRWLYSASRARQFPSFACCLNQLHDSPRSALFVHITIAICLSFLGDVNTLIGYVGFSQWGARCCTLTALLYIRWFSIPVHPEAIRLPIIFPLGFLVICLSLVVVTIAQDFATASYALGMFISSLILYIIFVWDKTLYRIPLYRQCADWINEKSSIFTQIVFDGIIQLDPDPEEEAAAAAAAEMNNNTAVVEKLNIYSLDGCEDLDSEAARAHKRPSAKVYPAGVEGVQ